MWGRLLTCGRLLIGLPGMKTTAWLQPCCPTIRRGSQRNEDLVVQASACAYSCFANQRVGQTIVLCGLSPRAFGPRNFMKKRTNCSVVVGVWVAFSTLPAGHVPW